MVATHKAQRHSLGQFQSLSQPDSRFPTMSQFMEDAISGWKIRRPAGETVTGGTYDAPDDDRMKMSMTVVVW